jgi:hypothetical protein
MINLKVSEEFLKIKDTKINIFYMGYENSNELIWIFKNIMNHNDSKLYIINGKKSFMDELKEYKSKIVNIEKNKDIFLYFYEKNIFFNIVFINLLNIENIFFYLTSFYKLLSKHSIMILLNINNKDIIHLFTNIYKNELYMIEYENNLFIKKTEMKNVNNIIDTLPLYITNVFDKYISSKENKIEKNIKDLNLSKIEFDFILNNNYLKDNTLFGYNPEIEKYNNYLYKSSKDDKKIKNIDLYYFIHKGVKETKMLKKYYLTKKNKNENIIKIFNIPHKIMINTYLNSIILKKKYITSFNLGKLAFGSDFIEYLQFVNQSVKIYNVILDKPKNKLYNDVYLNKYKSQNTHQIHINPNLFNFNNIIDTINKNPSLKYDNININITPYINRNKLLKSYYLYGNILLFNILYLILSTQKKNGELYLFTFPFTNKCLLQILHILSKYYKNIKIYSSDKYSNRYMITIHATYFLGISKDELENIYQQYSSFYQQNIHPFIDTIFSGKKINNLYLDNIISNSVNKKIENDLIVFNQKYHTFILNNIKIKIDIYEFLHDKNVNKKQKEFIYKKLLKKQIEIFNNYYNHIYLSEIKKFKL